MLKKLLLATTVCIALSACNDSSSSSSTEASDPLATLNFENLSNVSSIARVETSSEDGSHLIGFDANGTPIRDISNVNVGEFTPVSNGGFVVKVIENHLAQYQYQNLTDHVDQHDPINHKYRRAVWYYVQTTDSEDGTVKSGDYFLISDKRSNLPEYIGENSDGLLIFSDGETFNLKNHSRAQLYNNLKLDVEAIKNAVADAKNGATAEDVINELKGKVIEKVKSIDGISGDSILSNSVNFGSVLIESTTGIPADFSDEKCSELEEESKSNLCTKIVKQINNGNVSGIIGLNKKAQNLPDSDQILSIPYKDITAILNPNKNLVLLNTGLVTEASELDDSLSGSWDGESALTNFNDKNLQGLVLSTSFLGEPCTDNNKQCLYSTVKTTTGIGDNKMNTIESNFVIDANTGFETESEAGQIEGGQQNYLWVNDSYIVIKEATQISIIDRADNNKLLDPVLPGTEIDTINLTDDNKLYITATDSSGLPAAYIYDIAAKTGLDAPISNEKLHALKALIK